MGTKDKRVDAYIAKSAEFAQPILHRLRKLVHTGCPDVEETIKWGMPSFDYIGPFFSMAAFKQHCAFGFWKASLMSDPHKLFSSKESAMGHFGRIEKIADLPSDKILLGYIKEAARLNKEGIKLPKKEKKVVKKPLTVPPYIKNALAKNKKAMQTFEIFSPSHKREYLEWITEAKTEETRSKRLAQAIEWMAEGKPRNWKYMRK